MYIIGTDLNKKQAMIGLPKVQYILIHGITSHSYGSLQTENKYSLNVAFNPVLRDANRKKSSSIFRHPSGNIKGYMRRPTTSGNFKRSVSPTWFLNERFKSPFWRLWSLFKLLVFFLHSETDIFGALAKINETTRELICDVKRKISLFVQFSVSKQQDLISTPQNPEATDVQYHRQHFV